ncbi:alpha-keto acid decarboxylase family protein [Aquisphaera insulae]|uniref:alpha-keto acid decarboxylase family protein n=1 Tax=Aquisphaera insulae TaxID=2712864 RepID=UPI0013EDAB2A|nr:thiamine pyrophosphate-binding protein [Aquisphaera insulae]
MSKDPSPQPAAEAPPTTVQYVLGRLRQIGVTDYFGVPGDFAFPISDAICADPGLRFIGSCNELNAAYAADGYARIRGLAAISTTFGPGELGALPGIAGAYAEHLPIFHITGRPTRAAQAARAIVHHTLGDGEFDHFRRMTAPAVCASTIITPENCASETERLIAAALYDRRPVYMAIPSDVADRPIAPPAPPVAERRSDPAALEGAVAAIVDAVARAKTACILPGILVVRLGLRSRATAVIDASGLPFATMLMDKATLDEAHPSYIGMYEGAWSDEGVREYVEGADCVLAIGGLPSDFNTGAFTARLDRSRTINVLHHRTRVGHAWYEGVEMGDVLAALAGRLPRRTDLAGPRPVAAVEPRDGGEDRITAAGLYPRWARFLRPDDILVAETGTSSLGMASARMPAGSTFHNQTLWGAIGWATPAAFGAAMAAPDRRTVLITGDGSHQLTAQEVGQFHRFGLKPIIFVLNNDGYLIERLLCKDPDARYNDLAPWRYHELPRALGCDGWYTARVATCGELDAALDRARTCGTGAYIEVVTDRYEAPPTALKLHESTRTLYGEPSAPSHGPAAAGRVPTPVADRGGRRAANEAG